MYVLCKSMCEMLASHEVQCLSKITRLCAKNTYINPMETTAQNHSGYILFAGFLSNSTKMDSRIDNASVIQNLHKI